MFQDLKVAGKAFGMPTTLLVDPAGCEIATLAGPAEWASEDAVKLAGGGAREILTHIAAGFRVASRQPGCSVSYS